MQVMKIVVSSFHHALRKIKIESYSVEADDIGSSFLKPT